MEYKYACPSCDGMISSDSNRCPRCGENLANTLKNEVKNIFSRCGYETKKDHKLRTVSGETFKADIYAEYESELHSDKIVVECTLDSSPVGEETIQKIDEIIQNTEVNKGIVISPSGFNSKAESIAEQKGIGLLDKEDLPHLGVVVPLNREGLLEIIEGSMDLTIYYSVEDGCKKRKIFSIDFPETPKPKAIKKGFERKNYRLTDCAKIIDAEEDLKVAVDENRFYLLIKIDDEDEKCKYDVYTYNGIKLDHDFELEFKCQVTNNTKGKLKNIFLEGDMVDLRNNILNKIECTLSLNSDLFQSEGFLDSNHLFDIDISQFEKYIQEGKIHENIVEIFTKKGYEIGDDAEIIKKNGLTVISEEGEKRYLVRKNKQNIKIYETPDEKHLDLILPNDTVYFNAYTDLPFEKLIKNYDDLYLRLRVIEDGDSREERYLNLSSIKAFEEGFKEELIDLKNALDKEEEKSIGSENEGRRGCFIATAVYGDPNSEKIDNLRTFRDQVLLQRRAGKLFTDIYYKISPPIAKKISKNQSLKKIVGHMIVYPLSNFVEDVLKSK